MIVWLGGKVQSHHDDHSKPLRPKFSGRGPARHADPIPAFAAGASVIPQVILFAPGIEQRWASRSGDELVNLCRVSLHDWFDSINSLL